MSTKLIGVRGPSAGRTFRLSGDLFTVGRIPSNTLVVDDARASRRHAELRREGDHWVLHDLQSVAGTRVNGERVGRRRPLANGDVVEIGAEMFRFEVTSTASAAPALTAVELSPAFGQALGRAGSNEKAPWARVRFVGGPSTGVVVTLESDVISLGRTPDNAIEVQSQRASRRHAELRRERTGWVLFDLASSNGTLVNGQRVQRAELSPEDLVEIGEEQFRLEIDPSNAPRRDPMGPTEGAFDAASMMAEAVAAELAQLPPVAPAAPLAPSAPTLPPLVSTAPAYVPPPMPSFGPPTPSHRPPPAPSFAPVSGPPAPSLAPPSTTFGPAFGARSVPRAPPPAAGTSTPGAWHARPAPPLKGAPLWANAPAGLDPAKAPDPARGTRK